MTAIRYRVHEHYEHWFLKYIWRWPAAITLGHHILYKRKREEVSKKLRRHELVHVAQIEREGLFTFYFRYFLNNIRHGYRNNPYEIEARALSTWKDA